MLPFIAIMKQGQSDIYAYKILKMHANVKLY